MVGARNSESKRTKIVDYLYERNWHNHIHTNELYVLNQDSIHLFTRIYFECFCQKEKGALEVVFAERIRYTHFVFTHSRVGIESLISCFGNQFSKSYESHQSWGLKFRHR